MALTKKTLILLLSILMSEISEAAYCASWLDGTEYAIWKFLQDSSSDKYWKNSISPDRAAALRELSSEIDGWLTWDDSEPGEIRYVPMPEWERLYEAHLNELDRRQGDLL